MIQSVLNFIPAERRSQKDDLLLYLQQFGSITCFEAAFKLGIMQLSARIIDLERDGWRVPREWKDGRADNGRAWRVRKYLRPERVL